MASKTPAKGGADGSGPKKAGPGRARAGRSGSNQRAGSSAVGASPSPAARSTAGPRATRGRKPPPVVTRQPRPWGWIIAAVLVAVFAVGAIGYAVKAVNDRNAAADPANIEGLVTKEFASGLHVTGLVDYGADSPPFGGQHNGVWPDCNGDVYDIAISNEYAVHGLEHGAVWIAYNPDLSADEVATLAKLVDGQQYMFMSPYPGLDTAVSLQSWGHQLKVDSVDDPRIENFITALRLNADFTPELGASCDNPEFAANPIPADTVPPGATPSGSAAPTSGATSSAAPTSGAAPTTADPSTAP